MSPGEALLKAAEHIESRPRDYHWAMVHTPSAGQQTACMLGWAGHYLGMKAGTVIGRVAKALGLEDECDFYAAANKAMSEERVAPFGFTGSARVAAQAMRGIARARFPEDFQRFMAKLDLPEVTAEYERSG